MLDKPISLDERRGIAEQKAIEIRRRLAEVEADQVEMRQRRAKLENFLVAAPARTWREAAENTSVGRDPRRQKLIDHVLDDLRRLADASSGADTLVEAKPSECHTRETT